MSRLKVLLVEDNEDNRGIIRQLAEMAEFELLEAADGPTGLELARAERPGLILLDLSLPVINGWETARRLKQDPRTAAIPIVAVTAHAMAGDEARALKAGCDAYVAKPISLAPFLEMLEGYKKETQP